MTVAPVGTRNLHPNPSAEVDTTSALANAGTSAVISSSTDRAMFGTKSFKVVHGTASTTLGLRTTAITDLPQSTIFNVSVYIYLPSTNVATPSHIQTLFRDDAKTSSYATILRPVNTFTVEDSWIRFDAVHTVPEDFNCTSIYMNVIGSGSFASGDIGYFDGFQITKGITLWDYFDGSTPLGYADWEGVIGRSPSIRTIDVPGEGAAPVLSNYEYQFKDDGILINSDSEAVPFWDVTGIVGLDTPPLDPQVENKDSGHGAYTYAKWTQARTIVLDGILYAEPSTFEVHHDLATDKFFPDNLERPFYFKHPGVPQRYIMGKSLGYRSDVTVGRRHGEGAFQIQILCADTRKYIDNNNVTQTIGTSTTVTNDGKAQTWPIVEVTGSGAGVTVTEIENTTSNEKLTLTGGLVVPADQLLSIDTAKRTITLNGVDQSIKRAAGSKWPGLYTGDNTFIVRSSAGTTIEYVIRSKSAWW